MSMLKTLAFSLNVILIVAFGAWLAEDVSVTQDFPDRVDPLSEFEVTVHFSKGAVTGFAKYQQTMPAGVEVEMIEGSNATFTFSNQTIKFIWMVLPESEEFDIKYKVKVTDPNLTAIIMDGKFSYLDENQRMSYDVPAKEITVGYEEVTENQPVPEPVVSINRKIENISGQSYKVTISVTKENITGFAKVQDFIPDGAIVTENETSGAVFSVVDRKAKFVWLEIPGAATFDVAYTIDLTSSEDSDLSALFGEFSYLHEGRTQTEEIPGPSTEAPDELLVEHKTNTSTPSQSEPEEATTEKQPEPNTTSTPPVEDNATDQQTKEEIASDLVQKVTSTPQPQEGVFYRVQLLAGKKNVDAQYFSKYHQYNGEFQMENHEGWIKYTTGHHEAYRGARDNRENIKANYNFPGPFVVAYNSGERITVQEALMITGQQWLK